MDFMHQMNQQPATLAEQLAQMQAQAQACRQVASGYTAHADNLTAAAADLRALARVNDQQAARIEAEFPGLYQAIAEQKAEETIEAANAAAEIRAQEREAEIAVREQERALHEEKMAAHVAVIAAPPTEHAFSPDDEPETVLDLAARSAERSRQRFETLAGIQESGFCAQEDAGDQQDEILEALVAE